MTEKEIAGYARSFRLGENYAENKMAREVPTTALLVTYDEPAFLAGYDSYVSGHANFLALPEVPDAAIYAADACGDTCTARYCRDIASEANEYESNEAGGDYVALLPLEDADRVALTLLDALDNVPRHYTRGSFVSSAEDFAQCEAKPAEWTHAQWCVVYVASSGAAFPSYFASEDEARAHYSHVVASDFPSEDEEEDY